MNTTGKVFTALAAGAVIGGVLGLLFAPAKGTETRKKIADTGRRITDGIGKKFRKGKERMEVFQDDMKERLSALNSKAEELI